MNSNFKRSSANIVIVSLIIGILLTANVNKLKVFLVNHNLIRIEQDSSYIALTYEQQVKNADVIFVGKLREISPSKWNQDSGEYWSDDSSPRVAIPIEFHTLKFDVAKFIIDTIGAKAQGTIEVTVLGPSLLDGNSDYSLAIGDNVIVFAKKTKLAWKEGNHRKPIIEIVTAPEFAFFVQPNDSSTFFTGKVIHDLGKGNFATENISLPLPDLTSQIQSIAQKPVP